MEPTIHMIQWTDHLPIRNGCLDHLATSNTLQPNAAHQSLHRASGNMVVFTMELLPDLGRAVAQHIALPNAANLGDQHGVLLHTTRLQVRTVAAGCMPSITGWGDLQHSADRLDPESVAMLINKRPQDLMRRSSSALAKKALASFRISLARRSSLTSRSSVLMRSLSSVV